MRKGRFSVEQIVCAVKQVEGQQTKVDELCRKMGFSEQTFYTWKWKHAGMGAVEARELNQLREENRRLKQRVADLTLDKEMLQEVLAKSPEACRQTGTGEVARRAL